MVFVSKRKHLKHKLDDCVTGQIFIKLDVDIRGSPLRVDNSKRADSFGIEDNNSCTLNMTSAEARH